MNDILEVRIEDPTEDGRLFCDTLKKIISDYSYMDCAPDGDPSGLYSFASVRMMLIDMEYECGRMAPGSIITAACRKHMNKIKDEMISSEGCSMVRFA